MQGRCGKDPILSAWMKRGTVQALPESTDRHKSTSRVAEADEQLITADDVGGVLLEAETEVAGLVEGHHDRPTRI